MSRSLTTLDAEGAHRAPARLLVFLLVLAAVWGVGRAVQLRWSCDDAFLSYRYAQNLVAGHGLVYNAGEYVEGYSNLLWTLLLAVSMKLGWEPVSASQWLGILCYAALALRLAAWSWQRARTTGRLFLPLAATWALLAGDFHVWATGGLEGALFACLALEGVLLARASPPRLLRSLWTGFVLSCLVLTRLDGALVAAIAVLSHALPFRQRRPSQSLLHLILSAAPLGIVLLGLFMWKRSYYGDLFPTAYYAKSASSAYWSQGLIYLGLYLAKNWILPVSVLVLAVLAVRGRIGEKDERARLDNPVFLAAFGLYVAYVTRVGGDFMFARRLVVVMPFLFLAIEEVLGRTLSARLRVPLFALFLVGMACPVSPYTTDRLRIHGVADERRYYPRELLQLREAQGKAVGKALGGTGARVGFEGGMLVFGYYSELPYLAELTGLTQYSLAKRPVAERGLIGHEKAPDIKWFQENNIHFVVTQMLPPEILSLAPPRPYDELRFGATAVARILLYDDAIMEKLRLMPGVQFMPIEDLLKGIQGEMERCPLQQAANLYRGIDRYYLRAAGERGRTWSAIYTKILATKQGDDTGAGAAARRP